jgi:hypothetical protein
VGGGIEAGCRADRLCRSLAARFSARGDAHGGSWLSS